MTRHTLDDSIVVTTACVLVLLLILDTSNKSHKPVPAKPQPQIKKSLPVAELPKPEDHAGMLPVPVPDERQYKRLCKQMLVSDSDMRDFYLAIKTGQVRPMEDR